MESRKGQFTKGETELSKRGGGESELGGQAEDGWLVDKRAVIHNPELKRLGSPCRVTHNQSQDSI